MDNISTKEAADRLGISIARVNVLIQQKRLPAQKIGGVWIINAADLPLVAHRPNGYPKGKPRKQPQEGH